MKKQIYTMSGDEFQTHVNSVVDLGKQSGLPPGVFLYVLNTASEHIKKSFGAGFIEVTGETVPVNEELH